MLKSKSFLSIDFGAGSLKVAEFEPAESGSLRLKRFAIKPLGLEGGQEANRPNVLQKGLQELLAQGFGTKTANISTAGFQVFSKFVKLPPVDNSKVTQIIQYEAQQNVPFPLEEVVWDYQILGTNASGEIEVLLVAIKADVVEGLFKGAEANGLRMQIVDISHASLCNAFRFNYGDVEGCSMLLDIGAKTSNVLFFEKGRFYSRSINIGANSITQDFAAEAKMRFAEAEQFKISDGFVSLGGAYEDPENPKQAQISKIARQVLTRLHIQVNQTIQFYRGQQGGSAPQRLYLCGGGSVLPYTDQFFAEKLNLPVEYFNPFRNLEFDPAVNLEELSKVAQGFGEVVGLGLRNLAQCPVELNLMPKTVKKRQELNQKKPYFAATAMSLVAVVFALGWFEGRVAEIKRQGLTEIQEKGAPIEGKVQKLEQEEQKLKKALDEASVHTDMLSQRLFWNDLFAELRTAILDTERTVERQLGVDMGLWIESLKPDVTWFGPADSTADTSASSGGSSDEGAPKPFYMDPMMAKRYGLIMPTAPAAAPEAAPANTNELSVVKLVCRGVHQVAPPTADRALALELSKRLKLSTNFFEPSGTDLAGEIEVVDQTSSTFSFGVNLKLKRPIKL